MKEDVHRLFCCCNGEKHNTDSLQCADADMIVTALEDAQKEMNYSNWHHDKFDRAIKIVVQYCKDKGIPTRFVPED